jgi:hypothetical protein
VGGRRVDGGGRVNKIRHPGIESNLRGSRGGRGRGACFGSPPGANLRMGARRRYRVMGPRAGTPVGARKGGGIYIQGTRAREAFPPRGLRLVPEVLILERTWAQDGI